MHERIMPLGFPCATSRFATIGFRGQLRYAALIRTRGGRWLGVFRARGVTRRVPRRNREKQQLLGGAVGSRVPIHWSEAFRLTMIEAMACGTPTIAYAHGFVLENIEHGLGRLRGKSLPPSSSASRSTHGKRLGRSRRAALDGSSMGGVDGDTTDARAIRGFGIKTGRTPKTRFRMDGGLAEGAIALCAVQGTYTRRSAWWAWWRICGFTRRPAKRPAEYTESCAPQARSRAARCGLLGGVLGLSVDALTHQSAGTCCLFFRQGKDCNGRGRLLGLWRRSPARPRHGMHVARLSEGLEPGAPMSSTFGLWGDGTRSIQSNGGKHGHYSN
jgi:hypothetical protein